MNIWHWVKRDYFNTEKNGNKNQSLCEKRVSVQFSHSVMSNSLQRHGLQHAWLPCPSLSPGACSDSCPLSRWCHPTPHPLSPPSPLPSTTCLQTKAGGGTLLCQIWNIFSFVGLYGNYCTQKLQHKGSHEGCSNLPSRAMLQENFTNGHWNLNFT